MPSSATEKKFSYPLLFIQPIVLNVLEISNPDEKRYF